MLSQLIWWSSIALEALLLFRGLQTRMAFRFPYFYTYLAFVFFLEDLLSFLIKGSNPIYNYTFWSTECVGILLGCGVVLEIYRIGLARFPGTARMARGALALIFVLAATKGLLALMNNLYSIPIGKNLRGILFGYGLYVNVLAITLTFVPHIGHGFWFYALSASYPVALVTWLVHLWSYQERTAVDPPGPPEGDYKWAAAATRRRLQTARGELSRAVRP